MNVIKCFKFTELVKKILIWAKLCATLAATDFETCDFNFDYRFMVTQHCHLLRNQGDWHCFSIQQLEGRYSSSQNILKTRCSIFYSLQMLKINFICIQKQCLTSNSRWLIIACETERASHSKCFVFHCIFILC